MYAREETIFSVGSIFYKITSEINRTVEVTANTNSCSFYSGNFVIPDSVEYNGIHYRVTALGSRAFTSSTIRSLVLPISLQTIESECFVGATLPEVITFPDSLKEIKYAAFWATVGTNVISIPAATRTIRERAFADMYNLRQINVDTANPYYMSIDGVMYSKDSTRLLACPRLKSETFVIPYGVKYIESFAFESCKISNVKIPNTVTTIKNSAFSECESLRTLHIPVSVTNIEGGAFRICTNLTNFTIDSLNTNYTIVDDALYSINMDTLKNHSTARDTVRVLDGVKVIDLDAFAGLKKIKYVIMPESVIKILEEAFQSSNLRGISFSPRLQEIRAYAFFGCTLLTGGIEIPNTVKKIGMGAFYGAAINSVKMSDSVKIIQREAFAYCSKLNSYTGGASVERIEEAAFRDCGSFAKNIVFPPSLRVIEDCAFIFTEIKTVEFTDIVDTIGQSNFGDIKKLILVNPTPPYSRKAVNSCDSIIIPCGATQAYLSNPNWSSYNYTEDCDGIEDIDPQSAVQVVAQHKAVDVYNAENYSVAIYDLMGRCHTAEPATGYNLRHYTLPSSGVYIVRVNGKGYKVVVQ